MGMDRAMIAKDIFGDTWRIAEARPTPYGFDVLLGRPAINSGRGGVRVVLTQSLAEHLADHRLHVVSVDLPISRQAITRLRQLLGHDRAADLNDWWRERLDDLHNLTTDAFAAKHNVAAGSVSEARQKYLGERRINPAHWWLEPKALASLLSETPAKKIAEKYNISESRVRGLRCRLSKHA